MTPQKQSNFAFGDITNTQKKKEQCGSFNSSNTLTVQNALSKIIHE